MPTSEDSCTVKDIEPNEYRDPVGHGYTADPVDPSDPLLPACTLRDGSEHTCYDYYKGGCRDPEGKTCVNIKGSITDSDFDAADYVANRQDNTDYIRHPNSDGDKLPDSGSRREFSTGSVRDIRDGKGRFDLISPMAIRSIATRLEDGQQKYGERNWEKGQQLMSYLDSALRHVFDFIEDTQKGKLSREDHISAALWNLHSFIHTKDMIAEGWLPKDLDDLPTPERVFGLKQNAK